MRKVRVRFLKSFNSILLSLLALLGFTAACKDDPSIIDEYGSPYAKFKVNGKIEATNTDTPIENIRVVMSGDTVYSDDKGEYEVADNNGFPIDQIYEIQFQDIDGISNGEFEDVDTVVEFKDPEFINGDGWYRGETSKEFNIKLNPKK